MAVCCLLYLSGSSYRAEKYLKVPEYDHVGILLSFHDLQAKTITWRRLKDLSGKPYDLPPPKPRKRAQNRGRKVSFEEASMWFKGFWLTRSYCTTKKFLDIYMKEMSASPSGAQKCLAASKAGDLTPKVINKTVRGRVMLVKVRKAGFQIGAQG